MHTRVPDLFARAHQRVGPAPHNQGSDLVPRAHQRVGPHVHNQGSDLFTRAHQRTEPDHTQGSDIPPEHTNVSDRRMSTHKQLGPTMREHTIESDPTSECFNTVILSTYTLMTTVAFANPNP